MPPILSVSDFIAITNQILDTSYPSVIVEGEVASFKVNQGKFVFFSLKDATGSVDCFMMLFALRHPLEDGMKIRIKARPKLTNWGKFSCTVEEIIPVGQGSIKKSLDLLRTKLEKEGIFSPARKRPVANTHSHIAVISSTAAAGYHDFIKIVENRWAGLVVEVAHVQVQGMGAADQIIRAIDYFNGRSLASQSRSDLERLASRTGASPSLPRQVSSTLACEPPSVIALIRGGGSADDLAVWNDEALVRAIAASKIPTITGIGHEVDTTLADLAADLRASTPSNAAERLTRDRTAVVAEFRPALAKIASSVKSHISTQQTAITDSLSDLHRRISNRLAVCRASLESSLAILAELNPESILARGYALITGDPAKVGNVVKITTVKNNITAEVTHVTKR